MFACEIRRAIEAAPRVKLPEIAALLWRAYGDGHVSEVEAETLSNLIEVRKASATAVAPPRRPAGARPQTPESLERRRRWAASGRLPPRLSGQFTLAEQAVLAVLAVEVVKKGTCQLAIGHIAALAGVSESSVRNALRQARLQQLLTIEERRLSAWRSDTNIVRIVSTEWLSWLRLARVGGGCKSVNPTNTPSSRSASRRLSETSKSCRRAGSDPGRERSGKRPHAGNVITQTTSISSTR
nr:hypothetical protein [Methylobacterium sp. WL103]